MSRLALILVVVAAGLLSPLVARAQQPATPTPGERYIAMTGTGRAPVTAPERESDASIGQAVEAAGLVALPRAIEAARERAVVAARAAGLTLGAIESVDDSRYGPFLEFGRFGPGRYCGTVSRRVTRRTPGGRRVRRTLRVRECDVPEQASVIAVVTFAVQ
jgi:hypothetical protein